MKIKALKQAKSSDNYFPWTTTDMNFFLSIIKSMINLKKIYSSVQNYLIERANTLMSFSSVGVNQPRESLLDVNKGNFLRGYLFGQFTNKLFDVYLWKFHNFFFKAVISSCASLKSVRWKFTMIHTLNFMARCWLNGMTDSLQTKTRIKNILYSQWLPNLTKFLCLWALETG